MKTIKRILIAIVILIAIPLIIALFIKKDYTVTRQIVINQPKQEVFNYIKFLRNQEDYSKWYKMDPNVDIEYKGEDGTVGFISRWESDDEEVGWGEQEIKSIKEGERIDIELRFIKPFSSTMATHLETKSTNDQQTKVDWVFDGRMNYPLNFMLLFMDADKMIGNDLEIGLNNLKRILEQNR